MGTSLASDQGDDLGYRTVERMISNVLEVWIGVVGIMARMGSISGWLLGLIWTALQRQVAVSWLAIGVDSEQGWFDVDQWYRLRPERCFAAIASSYLLELESERC